MKLSQVSRPIAESDLIYVCDCGCLSFELIGDGSVLCANCKLQMDEIKQGRWCIRDDVAQVVPKEVVS